MLRESHRDSQLYSGHTLGAWLAHILQRLQTDPRTASCLDGVIASDDTTVLKSGKEKPGIAWLFKSTEQRFGLGYEMVSTHYGGSRFQEPECEAQPKRELYRRIGNEITRRQQTGKCPDGLMGSTGALHVGLGT